MCLVVDTSNQISAATPGFDRIAVAHVPAVHTGHRIYTTSFASVYPLYVAKAEKKGRTKAEVDEVVRWLTGYSQKKLDTPTMREIRYLDKLIDELAKGKTMEKILRK